MQRFYILNQIVDISKAGKLKVKLKNFRFLSDSSDNVLNYSMIFLVGKNL